MSNKILKQIKLLFLLAESSPLMMGASRKLAYDGPIHLTGTGFGCYHCSLAKAQQYYNDVVCARMD